MGSMDAFIPSWLETFDWVIALVCFLGATLLGLVLGSFSSVVIYRLPKMMEAAWLLEQAQITSSDAVEVARSEARYDLFLPGSSCVHCASRIPWCYNVPLLGYFLLKGRCKECGASIDARYWWLELLGAFLSLALMLRFGPGWLWVLSMVLSFGLLILAFIDFDHQILPDQLTLPLLWLGLLLSVFDIFVDSETSILGAVLGYGFLWCVHQIFYWLTGREGMGRGDFKLLALLGAWLGWGQLPFVMFLSSVLGALSGLVLIFSGRRKRTDAIPYGPFLAFSGWMALMLGDVWGMGSLSLLGLG